MTTDNNTETELDQVRRILLGPIEENNDARDRRIMDFIKGETTANAEHLDRMEARLGELSAMVAANRRATLNELGQAITNLAERPGQPATEPKAKELQGNVQALAATRNTR